MRTSVAFALIVLCASVSATDYCSGSNGNVLTIDNIKVKDKPQKNKTNYVTFTGVCHTTKVMKGFNVEAYKSGKKLATTHFKSEAFQCEEGKPFENVMTFKLPWYTPSGSYVMHINVLNNDDNAKVLTCVLMSYKLQGPIVPPQTKRK